MRNIIIRSMFIIAVMVVIMSVSTSALVTDQRSFWDMNTNGTCPDSLSVNNLTIVGNPIFTNNGIQLGAYNTSTTNGYFNHSDNPSLSITGDMTISAWVKFDDSSGAYTEKIVDKYSTPSFQRAYMFLRQSNEKVLRATVSSSANPFAGAQINSSTALDSNTWYNTVFRYKSGVSPYMEIWINGVNDTGYITTGTVPSSIADSIAGFYVGYDGGSSYLKGVIDAVGIWNRTLSSSEIMSLYNDSNKEYDYTPLITSPSINLSIPSNLSVYFSGRIEGSCENGTNPLDSVYINDSRFIFDNTTNISNWGFDFNGTGIYNISVSVSCNDTINNTGTLEPRLLIDTAEPTIYVNSPSDGYTTNESFTVDVSYLDDRLYNVSTVVYSPNGSILFSDSVEDLNVTEYNYTYTYNFTNLVDSVGTYNITFKGCDSHTKKKVNFNEWNIAKHDTGIDFGNCNVYFNGNMNKIEEINYQCNGDRCVWDFEFKNNEHDPEFYVQCENPIKYLSDSDYKGHLVSGENWIDAENSMGLNVSTYRIDDYTYKYTYLGDIKKITTKSIGELNCNYKNVSVVYVNGSLSDPPVEPTFSYGACPSTTPAVLMFGLILVIAIGLIVLGFITKVGIWSFFGGSLMFIMSWYISGCSGIIGFVIGIISLFLMIYSALVLPRIKANVW